MILREVSCRATCRCVQRCTPRRSPPIWFEHDAELTVAALALSRWDINPARTDPGGGWYPVSMDQPAQAGAPAGRHRCCVFILESHHTRTADEPGKASPGHVMGEQFVKLTRAADVERWPEQLEA